MSVAVGPRVSKEEFLRALGLDVNNPQHEQLYRAMREEAIQIYNEINRDNSALLESRRNERPPFYWHHIRQDRQRWGVMEIWTRAGPVTKGFFDRGATNGEYGPNWVTGWLLYSVFRSRDIRNNRRSKRSEDGGAGGNSGVTKRSKGAKDVPKSTGTYYDPVRNGTV
ncbi:hypothetical protein AJ80_01024 [Polytolypa hystricis UAMH7299]|uniref:Uncharacterized protein n=1 Tax=Polytolypa hystricis (strain UAMH7299) TaxID=1447883 RepID=A0A2B7YTE6_POLH7|nr:hypothetical protein AJ80_01024 [Polytolypa hystricis UAMH7299]